MKKAFFVSCLASAIQGLNMQHLDFTPSLYGQLLAQVEMDFSKDQCSISPNRLKAPVVKSLKKLIGGKDQFTDKDFPRDINAFLWPGETPVNGLPSQEALETVEWKRLGETNEGNKLFNKGSVVPSDIIQGNVGDCWFLAGAAAIAEKPGKLEEIFLNKKVSKNGAYAVNFYSLGVPHTVELDDYMPYINGKKVGARATGDGALWPLILEKAFAKMRGNFLHINGGATNEAIRYMRGGPQKKYSTDLMTADQIWDALSEHIQNGNYLTASSRPGSDKESDLTGIVLGHAYTIAGIKKLSNGAQLVKCRNPWGRDSYQGDYGSDSKLWTPKLLSEVPEAQNKDDGYIFVPIEGFKFSFKSFFANYNTEKMHMDYYLKFDDQPKLEMGSDPTLNFIGQTMKKKGSDKIIFHKLTVISTVAQRVWISLATYSALGQPSQCTKVDGEKKLTHFLMTTNQAGQQKKASQGGTLQLEPVVFEANTYQAVYLGLALADLEVSNDWSIVAWGENGPVRVYNNDGTGSAHFPVLNNPRPPAKKPKDAKKGMKRNKAEQPEESKKQMIAPKKPNKATVDAEPTPVAPTGATPSAPKSGILSESDFPRWAAAVDGQDFAEGVTIASKSYERRDGSNWQIYKNQSTKNAEAFMKFSMAAKDWKGKKHFHTVNIKEEDLKVKEDGKYIYVSFSLMPGQEIGWILPPGSKKVRLIKDHVKMHK